MDIGTKLRQARLDAGLSQRQLCGDTITRNMLSLIENGTARPSMDTLAYLAQALGKPMSFFLEDGISGNGACMDRARKAYARGALTKAQEHLQAYHSPDQLYDDEYYLLKSLLLLSQAERALDRPIYARELLEEAEAAAKKTCYQTGELEQRRLWLLAQVSEEPIPLWSLDDQLRYRAKMALQAGDARRCIALLDACEDRDSAAWHYFQGEAAFQMEDHARAAEHYRNAESQMPRECHPKLEACYRALGDYKMAYEYACKQR